MDNTNVTPVIQQETSTAATPAPAQKSVIAPICAEDIQRYDAATQAEIMRVADQVDPLQLDKIKAFGSIPLERSFDFAMEFMKTIEGTTVDRTVADEIAKLSEQASKKQNELSVAIAEPNPFQRFLMNIFTSLKDKRNDDAKVIALSCYKILLKLKENCKNWEEILQDNYCIISDAIKDVVTNGSLIERYLVAGRIAEKRIEGEIEQKREAYEQGGLMDNHELYEASKEGFAAFRLSLLNLEKSRESYLLHLGQLRVQRETNKKLQLAINFQATNSMTTAAQQIMASVLTAQNREILEGQRSITSLNDELITKVSAGLLPTEQEAEKLLLNSVYSIEIGLAAAKTVVQCCKAMDEFDDKQSGHISEEFAKLQTLVQELAPIIGALPETKPEALQGQTSSSTDMTF